MKIKVKIVYNNKWSMFCVGRRTRAPQFQLEFWTQQDHNLSSVI